jgi:hypothetical protein
MTSFFQKIPQLILNLVKRFLKLCNFDFEIHILQINYEFSLFTQNASETKLMEIDLIIS